MDRRLTQTIAFGGLAALLASAGCHSPFSRRGIPPEPRIGQDGGPAQFHSEPKPYSEGLGGPASPDGPVSVPGPYGPQAPAGNEGASPVPEHSNLLPGITNPGNSVDQVGQMGAPGMPPSPL